MSNRFFAILLIIIAVIGGVIFVSKNKSDTPSVTDTPPSNITTGKGTTGVTLVEYGDFQCPVCASFFPIVQQVKEKYGDQITFQFRNFPLSEIHPNAVIAARAAMAANNQGKFWEYHDLLYQNQTSWAESNDPVSILDGYAEQLGLDMQQFRSDRASNEINNV
ncbi:thioredoxin domain-containing protein, partial [Candidatus Saccharibacteria bacterium]|nr:thioredoxin domain-containing protein [Candidatus Saccharibacteria bacterium]